MNEELFKAALEKEDLILDVLANLSKRIRVIEDQLDSLQNNTVRQAEELENFKGETRQAIEMVAATVDMLTDDIVTLDERTQPVPKTFGTCPCPMCR